MSVVSGVVMVTPVPLVLLYMWQGLWWLPSVADADKLQPLKAGLAMAAVEAEGGPGGAELLKLAAAQRMSTDARRAAFCVVMGSEDYIDASDRLLRLPLKVDKFACRFCIFLCCCVCCCVAPAGALQPCFCENPCLLCTSVDILTRNAKAQAVSLMLLQERQYVSLQQCSNDCTTQGDLLRPVDPSTQNFCHL